MDEKSYVLGFSAFSGIGTIRLEKLIREFGSVKNAWNADESNVIKVLGKSLGEKFSEFRKSFDIEKYTEQVRKKDIHWLVPEDKEYPKLLKQLSLQPNSSPSGQNESRSFQEFSTSSNKKSSGSRITSGMTRAPFILFAKGNTELLSQDKTIAIVGTRKVTQYGMQVTEMLTRELVKNNFIIVSGMALGVDSIAHREALKNNGKTIAVLGSGVDYPTPREHAGLYEQILENDGLIISTFSPGEVANIGSFPARNAIIAGLSRGVVVTEGAADSGSLITAEYAKKFGRPIFAVPGQITSQLSKGTNNLIKNGAIPISSAQEILDSLGIMETQKATNSFSRKSKITPEEEKILDILESGPLHFDEIVRTIGKDSKDIGSLLSLMELRGILRQNTDGSYSL